MLSHNCEDLSWNSRQPHKNLGRVAHAPTCQRQSETGGCLGVPRQPVLAESVNSRFNERPCLDKQGGEKLRKTSDIDL